MLLTLSQGLISPARFWGDAPKQSIVFVARFLVKAGFLFLYASNPPRLSG